MTGRLRKGDRVKTPAGPGVITEPYGTFDELTPQAWHVVRLDEGGKRLFRTEQLEFVARLVASDPDNP